ncbi:MAG: type II toxin-antitoxin system prevent-host-death family antitoxin [Propionibacteriaceae bacterium]|nr:type II toxin-antitoxin system prevent-host-death family antitoxin [Propionibacteriaceae bacterium]
MSTITHRELRNNSAEVLRRVEAGETLRVTNHGMLTAVIGPAGRTTLDALISEGQARPARADASVLERLRDRLRAQPEATKTTAEKVEDARGRW